MRWTEATAEAVVKLRAIYVSGDFDRYPEFHTQQGQQRLYPVRWARIIIRHLEKSNCEPKIRT